MGRLSDDDVRRIFPRGPDPKSAVLLLIGNTIYAREGKCWRALDSKTYSTIEEMTRGGSD